MNELKQRVINDVVAEFLATYEPKGLVIKTEGANKKAQHEAKTLTKNSTLQSLIDRHIKEYSEWAIRGEDVEFNRARILALIDLKSAINKLAKSIEDYA